MEQSSLFNIFLRKKAKSVVTLFDKYMKPSFKMHSLNVANYAVDMWKILVESGNELLAEYTEQEIFVACVFHDIGKALIPDDILGKNDSLDETERAIIKEHPRLGEKILDTLSFDVNQPETFSPYKLIGEVANGHHERWDGKGYPNNVKGDAIPIIARLCAIADTYDAITSDRPYRKGALPEHALEVLICISGSQLDEKLVAPLLANTSWMTAAKPNNNK